MVNPGFESHVCANDNQNLMNIRLIRANLEKQIVALTSTQSMLRAIKDYADFWSRNFAVKVCLGKKQNLLGPNFELYSIRSVRVRRRSVWRLTFVTKQP